MSDKAFQWSLTTLTLLVFTWIIVGIVFSLLPIIVVIVIGIITEVAIGGCILKWWGKNYMEKSEGM